MRIVWEGEPARLGATLKMGVRWQVAIKCWIPGFWDNRKLVYVQYVSYLSASADSCPLKPPRAWPASSRMLTIFPLSFSFFLANNREKRTVTKTNHRSHTTVGAGRRKCFISPQIGLCLIRWKLQLKDPSKNTSTLTLSICGCCFSIQLPGGVLLCLIKGCYWNKKMCFFLPM